MSDPAEYHRTFVLYTPPRGQFGLPKGGYIQYVPQQYYDDEDERNNSFQAYQHLDDGVKVLRIVAKPDQDFKKYATAWEKLYSPLAGGDGTDPVVDENLTVVGHIG